MKRSEKHENPLGTKTEGLYRSIFENWNNLAPWKIKNQNMLMAKQSVQRLEADGYARTECRSKWYLLPHQSQLT